jgi:hypothetical protein
MRKFSSIWIGRIRCIEKYEGVGNEIKLVINDNEIDDDCLRELLGLFYRYDTDIRQLRQFANEQNESWLLDPKAFWHDRLFRSDTDSSV